MAGDTVITVIGNLTGDPELRFTPSGAAVVNFTIASTPRAFDKNSQEWKDQETLFMRCSWWREAAENAAESLHKGTRVIATGRLVSRSWDDKDSGQKRTVMEMQVEECGPSLKYATAKVSKAERMGHQQGGQQQQGNDPWSTPPQGQPQQGQWAPGPPQGPQQGAPQAPYPIPPGMYPQGQQPQEQWGQQPMTPEPPF